MLSARHSKVGTSLPGWHQCPQSGMLRDNALMERGGSGGRGVQGALVEGDKAGSSPSLINTLNSRAICVARLNK